MKSLSLKDLYANQIATLMEENGLDDSFGAEVKNCTDIMQVFQALGEKGAKHIAVLTETGDPIEDMFAYIKGQLAENKSVPLALFYEKDEAPIFYS